MILRNEFFRMSLRRWINFGFIIMIVAGCAGAPKEKDLVGGKGHLPEPDRMGVYHKVKKGQTLWRIAKTYDVSISDIIGTNNIPNAAQLEENQLLFIPGAYAAKDIIFDRKASEDEFIWPINGKVVGFFHNKLGNHINKGINIRAQEGQIVRASKTGYVVFADDLPGYGKTVILGHTDGYYSVYGQNAEILVKLGALVVKNTPIGKIGRSERMAYLHFEIRKNAIEDNPLHYLP